MSGSYADVAQIALVPAFLVFFFGWLIGTTDTILPHHVDGINRYTLMISLPMTATSILTQRFFEVSELRFIVPFLIHKTVMALLFAIPGFFLKKYTLGVYNMLQMNANYSNNIVYGNAFLISMYPSFNMGLLCVLSAVPDSIGIFPFSLFICEFDKMKKETIAKNPSKQGHFNAIDALKLVPKVIFRVVTNMLVWGMLLGLILNFCRITKPLWLKTFIQQTSSSNFSVVMFNIGLFSAHAPALKINWGKVKAFFKKRLPHSAGSNMNHVKMEEMTFQPNDGNWGIQENNDREKESFSSSEDDSCQKESVHVPSDKISDASNDENVHVEQENEHNQEMQSSTTEQSESSLSSPFASVKAISSFPLSSPFSSSSSSSSPPPASPSPSSSFASPRPHINIPLVILFALIRFVISPLVMLAIILIPVFSPSNISSPLSLRTDQQHAAVLINALPLSVVTFALSKEFNMLSGEITLSIVLQSFFLVFPVFVAWYAILNKIFPLQ